MAKVGMNNQIGYGKKEFKPRRHLAYIERYRLLLRNYVMKQDYYR